MDSSFMNYLKPQPAHNECFNQQNDIEARSNRGSKCTVCFDMSEQLFKCENCSQATCTICIQQWSIEQNFQCPNCFYVFKDLPVRVESQQPQQDPSHFQEDVCFFHKERLNYYCLTCDKAICTDCAMLGETHKNHCFERLEKVYEDKLSEIRTELDNIAKTITMMTQDVVILDDNLDEVEKRKQARVKELQTVLEQMSKRLEKEKDTKVSAISLKRKDLQRNIELLKNTQIQLNEQINGSSKIETVEKSRTMLKQLQDMKKNIETKASDSICLDFSSEVVPEFESAIFKFENFSSHFNSTEFLYSEPIQSNGVQWRLKVYPNGSGSAKGSYISVFLEMTEGSSSLSRYEYKIELINQNGENLCKDFTSEFQAGQCWGYNKFIKLDTLEKEGFLIPEVDMLVFRFQVRTLNFYQQCQEQKRYIKLLEEQQKESKRQLSELQKKLQEQRELVHQNKCDEIKNHVIFDLLNLEEKDTQKDFNQAESRGDCSIVEKLPKFPKQADVCENFEIVEGEEHSFQDISFEDCNEEETTKGSSKEVHSTIIQIPDSLKYLGSLKDGSINSNLQSKLDLSQKESKSFVHVGYVGENLENCIEEKHEDLLSSPISPRRRLRDNALNFEKLDLIDPKIVE